MSKISIIIPCYNAEKTIEKCAESLFAQTIGMERLELIFVNDASTDGTKEKLCALEEKYPEQIMVVNLEENGKQGAARNIGLSYATGKYVGFLDADDYMEPNMYERLYTVAEKYQCDMAGGGYINESIVVEDGAGGMRQKKRKKRKMQKMQDALPLEQVVDVANDEERKRLLLLGTNVHFGARIYRLDLIKQHEIYFPERIFYEDNYWQSLMNMVVGRYYICSDAFYHYVTREDSTSNHVTEDNILQSMKIQVMLLEEYRKKGLLERFYTELMGKFYKSHSVMNLLGAYLEWNKIPDAIYEQMYEDVKGYGRGGFENPYIWKCDGGLLAEIFAGKRPGWERNLCMQCYMELLNQGRVQEWKPVFVAGSQAEQKHLQWEEYKEKCFWLGLHAQELQQSNEFMDGVQVLLDEAGQMGWQEDGTAYLEQMIARKGEFDYRYRRECPVLVYRGDDTCYQVLDSFANQFILALRKMGIPVEEYDISKKGAEGLLELIGKTYRAVVGFQTYLFSVHLQDGRNVHDCINAPKFHFIFDHPLWMKEHLEQGPEEYYILTHGKDYQEFVEKYFKGQVKGCYLLPPAGIEPEFVNEMWGGKVPVSDSLNEREAEVAKFHSEGGSTGVSYSEKTLDISFVGTWYDYRERLAFIRNTKTRERYLANRFLLLMKKHPNLRAEWALQQALTDYGIVLSQEDFKAVMFDFKQVCFAIMTYYREKMIRYLLEEGFTIHVYGDSWKGSPLVKYENLVCHPQVSVAESMEVWKKSKLSLNIMSWHKGGFTERIANMLLCETVVVSDRSDYLVEHFADDENIVLFDLEHPEKLAKRLRELLADDKKCEMIAKRGREVALQEHTWEKRTEEFWTILEALEEELA